MTATTERNGADAIANRPALEAFLRTAPSELSDWAEAQLAQLGTEPEPEPVVCAEDEEPADFYDDMEADDDILRRPHRAGSGTPTAERKGLPPALRGLLILAVIIGVAGGIWYAGHNGEDTQSDTAGTTSGQVSTEDLSARLTELENAVGSDPQNAEARLELGVLYFNMGLVEQAREQWDAVIEIDDANVTAWYNLGFYYLSSDPADMDAAQDAWQRVVELEPDSEMAGTIGMHMQGLEMSDE